MGLNEIFEEQQNATKLKMVIYFTRKDWLSKTRKVKWKLSETGAEVLEILNTPWSHIEEKTLRMTILHKDFFGII